MPVRPRKSRSPYVSSNRSVILRARTSLQPVSAPAPAPEAWHAVLAWLPCACASALALLAECFISFTGPSFTLLGLSSSRPPPASSWAPPAKTRSAPSAMSASRSTEEAIEVSMVLRAFATCAPLLLPLPLPPTTALLLPPPPTAPPPPPVGWTDGSSRPAPSSIRASRSAEDVIDALAPPPDVPTCVPGDGGLGATECAEGGGGATPVAGR
mmetsp:Transcript_82633/g.233597  ORF Transcript_82633/g.233597 Transcript_82633/m.233597 type:complete len:212 (+) Transcript_82633:1482-2117(+)